MARWERWESSEVARWEVPGFVQGLGTQGESKILFHFMWRRGVVVITTAQLHSTKLELRFHTGSNPACSVSEIHIGEDL